MIEKYKRPSFLFNGHVETIYPALFRKFSNPPVFSRQRISTPDGDFLDLDWIRNNNKKIIILQHGLEGSSSRPYMIGMTKIFSENGYDVCSWNYRGCGEELNIKPIFYHSGATYDLDEVVKEAAKHYKDITLLGFSLGGNLTLKYIGERKVNPVVKRAVAISVPLNLASGAQNLSTPKCYLYEKRFLKSLLEKVKSKSVLFPGSIDLSNLNKVKTIFDFDEYFTAPLHGFDGAVDYYKKNSSKNFLDGIAIPTLILNAQNDPLLTPDILDKRLTEANANITYEIPLQGGHVGFALFNKENRYWSEKRALDFCQGN